MIQLYCEEEEDLLRLTIQQALQKRFVSQHVYHYLPAH